MGTHIVTAHPELADRCTECGTLTTSLTAHARVCPGPAAAEAETPPVMPAEVSPPAVQPVMFLPMEEPPPSRPVPSHPPVATVTGEFVCTSPGCQKRGPYENARKLSQHMRIHPEGKTQCLEPGCRARVTSINHHYRGKHPGKTPPGAGRG